MTSDEQYFADLEANHAAANGHGRVRAEIGPLVVREVPAGGATGAGLALSGAVLDADDIERLADECDLWLAERGRSRR